MADRLKRALLDLLCPDRADAVGAGLAPQDWAPIDAMAGQHRLRPLLDARAGPEWTVPAQIRRAWHDSARRSALRALQQQAVLMHIDRLFRDAGIAATVLKGGALVWNGWVPAPLRPMRDLDLLLDEPQAMAAHALLRRSGFTGAAAPARATGKHLPGLRHGSGVLVEVHTRLFDTHDAATTAREAAWRGRAVARAGAVPGLAALSRFDDTDLMLHVIIHGVLDHRLNSGPLMLFDLAMLLRHGTIDLAQFHAEAQATGASRAAALAMHMARRWPLLPGVDFPEPAIPAAPATVEQAGTLMLVDMQRRRALGWAAHLAGTAPQQAIGRLVAMWRRGRARSTAEMPSTRPESNGTITIALSCLAVLLRSDHRRHIGRSVHIAHWLRRGP